MGFEKFKARHQRSGESMSQALRNQSDMIMNATFDRDPAYRKVYIDGKAVDAKYMVHSYRSYTGDDVDYKLQFRPGVYYPPGTYVDIPNRDNKIERWLIVMQDDQPQFPLHYILKCNWTLKWVDNGKIYSCLGVQRSRNNYNAGIWRSWEMTTVENQTQLVLPTTQDVKTINYGLRVIITNNEIHPLVWNVTKVEDTLPIGLSRITFSQDQFDATRDNAELMIADYYSTNLGLSSGNTKPPRPSGDYSAITFRGTKQVLKVNGSYKTFVPKFYDKNKTELTKIEPVWDIIYPSDDDVNKFDVIYDGKNLKIKCLNYYDLIGKIVTICLNDKSGTMPSTIDMEVVSL